MWNTAGCHVRDIHSALVTSGEACFPPFQPHSKSSGNKWALMLKAYLFQMTAHQINTAKLLPNIAHGDTKNVELLEHSAVISEMLTKVLLLLWFCFCWHYLTALLVNSFTFLWSVYVWMKSKMREGCLHFQIVGQIFLLKVEDELSGTKRCHICHIQGPDGKLASC